MNQPYLKSWAVKRSPKRRAFGHATAVAVAAAWLMAACGGGDDNTDTPVSSVNAEQTAVEVDPEAKDWVKVADENQTFTVTGTRTVRYGSDHRWIVKEVTGIAPCSNSYFGEDPAIGTFKQCQVKNEAPAPITSTEGSCGDADFAQHTLALVNRFRSQPRTCGYARAFAAASALSWNEKLKQASLVHSTDMAKNHYFGHTSLDGRTFDQRIKETGYSLEAGSENIAVKQCALDQVMTAWQESEAQCTNLMNPTYKEVGLACVSGAHGSRYWTMVLATPK
jgi:uncharacterized protein YkwD